MRKQAVSERHNIKEDIMKNTVPRRAILFGLFTAAPVIAASTALLTPRQKEQCDRIAGSLIAPCCWRETVKVHRSPESMAVRESIEAQVREGKSDQEIIQGFVGQYGERILREPTGQKAVWLNVVPLVAGGAGFAALAWFIRRHTVRVKTAGGPEVDIPPSELE